VALKEHERPIVAGRILGQAIEEEPALVGLAGRKASGVPDG
jgi:hypothetical protein